MPPQACRASEAEVPQQVAAHDGETCRQPVRPGVGQGFDDFDATVVAVRARFRHVALVDEDDKARTQGAVPQGAEPRLAKLAHEARPRPGLMEAQRRPRPIPVDQCRARVRCLPHPMSEPCVRMLLVHVTIQAQLVLPPTAESLSQGAAWFLALLGYMRGTRPLCTAEGPRVW